MNSQSSLLISTYNRPDALELCLKSVLQQTILPAEVLIADDGSGEETRKLIDAYRQRFPVPLIHVWHPDEGFQLAKIRNRGIARATQPYIIQIDGDLVLHPRFVQDHLQLAERGYFISGSRVLLSEDTTTALLAHRSIDIEKHNKGSKNHFNKLRNGFLRKFLSTRYKVGGPNKYYVKGCNMAFWKEDLLKVNGYNEKLTGWGKEDSELAIRLINAGVKKKFLKMGGITYHLYHPEASRENEEANTLFMNEAIASRSTWAAQGLSQYVTETGQQAP